MPQIRNEDTKNRGKKKKKVGEKWYDRDSNLNKIHKIWEIYIEVLGL